MRETRANIAMGRGEGLSVRSTVRQGLTVVEVLVVVALLVVISAMVMPAMSGWRDEAAFESIKREIGGELASCRARAMREGIAQRVVVHPDGRLVRVAWSGPAKAAESEGLSPPPELTDVGVELLSLPTGISLAPRKVDADESASAPAPTDSTAPPDTSTAGSEADAVSAGLTLVLFLPDGTMSQSRADWRLAIRRGGERAKPLYESRLRIDGWTGGASWEAIRLEPDPLSEPSNDAGVSAEQPSPPPTPQEVSP